MVTWARRRLARRLAHWAISVDPDRPIELTFRTLVPPAYPPFEDFEDVNIYGPTGG